MEARMNAQKDWVDFRAIKQAVSMQAVLDRYGINWLRKNKDELRGRCPIHKGDGERSFHVSTAKSVFQCFSCKARGNVLDFVAAMEQCSIRDAALKLKDWFKVGESGQPSAAPATMKAHELEPAPVGPINPPLSFELRVDHTHEYGASRGLLLETLELFGAGLCLSKGMFAGRFIIPLHNPGGELVGYAGRSLDGSEPKYLFPSSAKGFYKSHLLFGFHRVAPATKQIILVEGFFATMYLWQIALPTLGLFGSSLSKEQEAMIAGRFDRVLLLFDGDDAGRTATDTCLARLGKRIWIRAVSLPDGVQPDNLLAEELAANLAVVFQSID
jgi:DNA primase